MKQLAYRTLWAVCIIMGLIVLTYTLVEKSYGQETFNSCFVTPCQLDDNDGITLIPDACELKSNEIWHDASDHCFCSESQPVGCNISTECPGRCGPGCGSTGAGVYSLDCAEHDRCCRVHGGCLNPFDSECGDEYREAADDFLFGSPNCSEGCLPLDLIFVIDLTGSMFDDIAAVKIAATGILNKITSITKNYRIGLVTYKDFPISPYGEPEDFPFRTNLGFSTDISAVISSIQALTVGGGADEPESVYSALMNAISFPWRDGATKAIVLMGDAPPHDPEPTTGYTSATVTTAAKAVDPAKIYPIVIGFSSETKSAFSVLAERTEGKLFEAPIASDVVEAIINAIGEIVTPTNNPPDCTFAVANPSQIWPPNHKFVPINIIGVTDPDNDPVTIRVTGITQDEPVKGLGSGDQAPDGAGIGQNYASVRAERAGTGNSRVYEISFTATDSKGGECTGSVLTAVLHAQGANTTVVNDGQNYDSTTY